VACSRSFAVRFAANWYNVDYHIVKENGPPIDGASAMRLPFGVPPFEMREIWVVEASSISQIADWVNKNALTVTVSSSGFWLGDSIENPGERMLGLGVCDDVSRTIDERDLPCGIISTGRD
jgi:hypothetical protein